MESDDGGKKNGMSGFPFKPADIPGRERTDIEKKAGQFCQALQDVYWRMAPEKSSGLFHIIKNHYRFPFSPG
ncbi:MAG: hypothetical protein LUG93_03950 [Lachnospiraceae bacterium]|nr:hypothetical protein [Lachnospiraceae bacterium]